MKNKITVSISLAILFLSLIVGLGIMAKRLVVESKNSSVELAMDFQDIKKLSLLEGQSVDVVLKTMKHAGITSIALTEDTLETLELNGEIVWLTGKEKNTLEKESKQFKVTRKLTAKAKTYSNPLLRSFVRSSRINPLYSYVLCSNPDTLALVKKSLILMLCNRQVKLASNNMLEVADDEEDLMNLGLFISPSTFRFLINRGFYVVPRLVNNFRLDGNRVLSKLSIIASYGPYSTVIFDGEEVAGYKSNVAGVACAMKKAGINYGYIEMAEQKGDSALLKEMNTSVTRVHSISDDEMAKKMTENEAIDRFERSVSERGVRLLFIRPFYTPDSGMSLLKTNAAYVAEIVRRLSLTGHKLGPADRPSDLKINNITISLLSLGVASGLILLMSAFFEVPVILALILLILSAVVPYVLHEGHLLVVKKSLALLSASVFPALAMTTVFRKKDKSEFLALPIARPILMTITAFIISMAGAILVIGLLADTSFMLGSQQFTGIKIAFILPVIITAFYAAVMESGSEIRETFMAWLGSPVTVMSVFVAAILAAAGALYILRSGNFGIGVLQSERVARSVLENLMIVRPRTKEFLIGYPALFLASVYYLRGGRKWLWALLVIGVVGPVSTLNTFCHIHSPLLLSLLRTVYGLIFGIVFGLVYLVLYSMAARSIKK